jgi:hypothetical protein
MLWLLGVTDVQAELKTLPPADQHLYVNLAGRDPDDAPGTVYEKGALFLRLLEETAGRERWDRFLRQYFETFKFQPMTTVRFIEYLKASLPDVVRKVNIDEWIHGPGLPADAPKPHSEAFTRVEAQARAFGGGATADTLKTDGWTSHERVHFIQSLPVLTPDRMAELDRRFHFSESLNSEVLFVWLEKAIDVRYKDAYPAIERFLTSQGRRKFVKPLFDKLVMHPDDLEFARSIYTKARPAYHPVTRNTIDVILKWREDPS